MNAHRRSSSAAPTTGSARTVVTVARLLGKSIIARTGRSVGRVDDIVVRVDGGKESPPVTGIVAAVGGRRVYVPTWRIRSLDRGRVSLSTNAISSRGFALRSGEILVRAGILGHRFVDRCTAELVLAVDAELDNTGGEWMLSRVVTCPRRRIGTHWRVHDRGRITRDWTRVEPSA
ncbi:hypothetical protein CJ179_43530 [Rhodococcus sp. ACS1]|jgi:sporulation protein YlmC with PRC-barrel domain|uniref:PRC-barrel domain-containing protein n=1 Tax=Rhodococcus sp. ACS1 TaxID=2028570 RepID=UPI000BB0FB7C|nr:PRC-barrel domain-containing protein [Rhodococcus sp. ACS1]PBC36834.1 hypothetical protein CJ179_43530 [Rhodococcus sp. ACS1]